MSTVPRKDIDAIEFFEQHADLWAEAGPLIGASEPQTLAVKDATDAARAKYDAQQAAKLAAKVATSEFRSAMTAMRTKGGDLIKTIKAFAANSADPAVVYQTAAIDPPAPPTPQPPPGQPTEFTFELTTSGALTLKWKSTNSTASSGVYFTVSRKLAGESNFSNVGTTAGKTFTDDTIPSGTTSLSYQVQGFRGPNPGTASIPQELRFGMGGSGTQNAALKIAA